MAAARTAFLGIFPILTVDFQVAPRGKGWPRQLDEKAFISAGSTPAWITPRKAAGTACHSMFGEHLRE
jgi:hypothetical protein